MALGNHLGAHNDVGCSIMYLFKQSFSMGAFFTAVCIDPKDFFRWPV
jgi:hypothetical protein